MVIKTEHIKKLNRGYKPKYKVVLDVLLMALQNDNAISVSDFDSLARYLRFVACKTGYKAFPCHTPIDISYFKGVWRWLEQYEFKKRHIIVNETKNQINIFKEV